MKTTMTRALSLSHFLQGHNVEFMIRLLFPLFIVNLGVPTAIGGCDNLTIDTTTSSGAGGMPWASVVWRSNYGIYVLRVNEYLSLDIA